MHKQNPKWLELFITAFGAQGIVALAWWLGSLHAERIRSTRGSFPILNLVGGPGTGKSCLVFALYCLLGETNRPVISAARTTRSALLRQLHTPIDWPVVIEDICDRDQNAEAFDWESIKACYSGTTMARLTASERSVRETRFQGALVIVGGVESDAIHQRTVQLTLDRGRLSEQSRAALNALFDLPLAELATFKDAAKRHRAQLLNRLQKDTPAYIDCLLEDTEHALMLCDTNNHAKLRVLIDALQDLYSIPYEQAQAAHALVHDMAWRCCAPRMRAS